MCAECQHQFEEAFKEDEQLFEAQQPYMEVEKKIFIGSGEDVCLS
jgi:hypothetical protein